ncbi:MAG: hypothetical protein HY763_03570 [Planctomycetes bacterium]|nr:hypothetical protein [Planctomycetota bacterium]
MVQTTIALEQFVPEPPEEPSHGGCGSCGSGRAAPGAAKCGNGLEKIYPTTAVRFGYMRYIGEFTHAADMKFTCGAKVIIQTRRGIEMGDQVSLTCSGCSKSVTRDQMRAWVDTCGDDSFVFDAGRILREATAADLAEYTHIQTSCREKRRFCQELANRYRLPMRVVECECPFGGERIIFYFTAAERIDFRCLVKDLAKEYRTRIELRQVGARDEARLLADFETCGREVCCKAFLKTLRPVSMRMAKVQKATLDPTQVSGRCGRLKCCLRYEHVGYEELDKRLPRVGVRIRTQHGEGVIVNRQILTQLVQIRTDADKLITVVAEDIVEVGVKAPEAPPPGAATATPVRPTRRQREPLAPPRRVPPPSPPPPPESAAVQQDEPETDDAADESAPPAATPESETPRRGGRRRRGRRRPRGQSHGPDRSNGRPHPRPEGDRDPSGDDAPRSE